MFYAAHQPRNFGNEYTVKGFATKAERENFCERINSDLDQMAQPLTRDEAIKWAKWRGNEITEAAVGIDENARKGLKLDRGN
jgi:hypothetical protein